MKPVFTMLVGLPGSGKSSLAQEILRRAHDTEDPSSVIWISSDGIRAERYGSESVQGTASEVFSLMGKRTKEALRSGRSVIYDATNIRSRYRRSILMELGRIDCEKVCMIMATPLDMCVERDRKRDRSVGEQIIRRKMYLNWETPYP
ncbi:MAG: AAA family ATPase, partial [Mogibacterium sp.]|nr:AAA family ATPase [Mogibacterium sp.]